MFKQAKMCIGEKWEAKHECEELKEGVWLEPTQAMLQRRTNELWTDKHHNVMRKLAVEGGWVQKRTYDIGWPDAKKCRGCKKGEAIEKYRLYHCLSRREVRNQIPERLGEWEHIAKPSKDDWTWQRGITSYPLSENSWRKSPFVSQKIGI